MSSWLSPEEIRAAAQTHQELGPAYQDAVIESFLDRVGKEIDARVDARLAQPPASHRPGLSGSPLAVTITSPALGIPFSAIAVAVGRHWSGALVALTVVWIAIATINVACSLSYRSRPRYPDRR